MHKNILFGGFFSLILTACGLGGVDENLNLSQGSGESTGVLTGRLIDATTRQPVQNAQISLVLKDQILVASQPGTDNPELAGQFYFEGLPPGTHKIKISAENIATVQYRVLVLSDANNAPFYVDLGSIPLGAVFSVTSTVKLNSEPFTNATVYARPLDVQSKCNPDNPGDNHIGLFSPIAPSENEFAAVTNENGIAELAGLSQCWDYEIFVPHQDKNDDSLPDFVNSKRTIISSNKSHDDVEINLLPVENRTFDLAVHVSSSAEALENVEVVLNEYGTSPHCDKSSTPPPYTPYEFYDSYYGGGSVIYASSSSFKVSANAVSSSSVESNPATIRKSDESGKVTFTQLDFCKRYEVSALPFDKDDDGYPDFSATPRIINDGNTFSRTVSLAMDKIEIDEVIQIVGSSQDNFPNVSMRVANRSGLASGDIIDPAIALNQYHDVMMLSPADTLKIVFNVPVRLSEEEPVTVSYRNILVNPDQDADDTVDPDFGGQVNLEVTSAFDDSGMILTITPAEEWPVNQVLSISGNVTNDFRKEPYSFKRNAYVEDSGESGLAEANIKVDNFRNLPGNGVPYYYYDSTRISLLFPEWVEGTYKVVSVTRAETGVKHVLDSSPVTIGGGSSYYYYNNLNNALVYSDGTCENCVNEAGTYYVVRLVADTDYDLPYEISNLQLQDGDSVTVQLKVKDAKGNQLDKEITFTVL